MESPIDVLGDKERNSEDQDFHLPYIARRKTSTSSLSAISTSSLVENMGLAGTDERSLSLLLRNFHSDLVRSLAEARTITTHDDNLEKQYKETVCENIKLKAALERARREITSLKGRLTVLELTSSEIREERQRRLLQSRKLQKQETHLQQKAQKRDIIGLVTVPSYQDRARTVNSQGEYIDYSRKRRTPGLYRRRTFPLPAHQTTLPATSPKTHTLPPPLVGCSCSACNTQQSLGAVTLGKKSSKLPPKLTKSGQQILLGDRVVVKGEQLGTIKYIGKLEFDPLDRVFIGVHLDAPVGITDGAVKGKRYFQCPPLHGVFLLPHDILCVTGRKPRSSGTSVPRVREISLVTKKNITRSPSQVSETKAPSVASLHTPSMIQAKHIVDNELKLLLEEKKSPESLVNPSVSEMSKRIIQLRVQARPPPPQTQETESGDIDDQNMEEQQNKEETDNIMNDETTQQREDPGQGPTLHDVILSSLQGKDLGSTGYVTINELSTILRTAIELNNEEVESILIQLGLQDFEGHGIEYEGIIPYLVNAIVQNKKT